jgi:subtilisin family serine protease
MMKARINTYLNIRTGKPEVLPDNNPVDSYYKPGDEIEIAEIVSGEEYKKNKTWYKLTNGTFVWSGGVTKQSFSWFRDLEIENIWNKYGEYGDNATIAILDTGYDLNNPDLPVPVESKLFIKNVLPTTTVQDKIWHGTFCTSLIAARNQAVNIGVAPQCRTLIGKVSLAGELLDVNTILDGIEWAIQGGADIISISMGKPLSDQQQIRQLQTRLNLILQDRNVLIFAACGDSDSGQIISKEFYPASLDNCVSVGTVQNNLIHNITVRSYKTILHTVGVDIEGYVLKNVIEKQSGTSMSVPIIAGIMALAVSLTKKKNNGVWKSAELLRKLIQTGDSVQDLPDKTMVNPQQFFQTL